MNSGFSGFLEKSMPGESPPTNPQEFSITILMEHYENYIF